MARKIENWQFPIGKKSEKGDKEFTESIGDALDSIEIYEKIKNEYLLKLEKFEQGKKELAEGEKEGRFSYNDKKTLTRLISELDEELKNLDLEIKELAGKNSEIVLDPRFGQTRFEHLHGNPNKSDS
jgi:hypothetical protein